MKALLINRCADPLRWYAEQVGQLVPFLGESQGEFKSREPAGHLNFVQFGDATVVEVFTVMAGKYEGNERSCKVSVCFKSLDDAMDYMDKVAGYPWRFIEYRGRFLELLAGDFSLF